MISPITDCQRLARRWREQPRAHARLYAKALPRAFVPRPKNNDFRKLLATGLFLVWVFLTVGQAYSGISVAIGPIQYGLMTAVVYTIIGIQWGFEIEQLGPVEISYTDDSDQSQDQNDGPG